MKSLFYIIINCYINNVYCFFAYTHSHLGESLYNRLSYNVKTQIKVHTTIDDFKEASIWADKVKHTREFAWTSQLHYIDTINCSTDYYKYCENKCILTGILNMTNRLKYNLNQRKSILHENFKIHEKSIILNENANDFRLLIHFLQDIVQPMHSIGEFRGGNDFSIVLYKNNSYINTNMHTLWDKYIPEYFINNNITNISNDICNYKIPKNMFEFESLLINIMKNITINSCHKIYNYQNLKHINFMEYYLQHIDIIYNSFNLYNCFSIITMNFIFDDNLQ